MADYTSVRLDWWALLNWHLKENGTRPLGNPDALGRLWDDGEFALACNVGDARTPRNAARTVQNWLDKDHASVTPNCDPIEKALMGESAAYTAWRRDLRAAHRNALNGRKDSQRNRKPVRETQKVYYDASSSRNISVAVQEGLFIRVRGTTQITPSFFMDIWQRCTDVEFIRTTIDPDQDLGGDPLLAVFFARLVGRAVKHTRWELTELTNLMNNAGREIHEILEKKARDVGLLILKEEAVTVAPDVLESFVCNLFGRIPDGPFKSSVYWEIFQTWKIVARVAVESMPGEDARYADILALFMYAAAYDNGIVEYCTKVWEEEMFGDGPLHKDDGTLYSE
jgi:hypothetical protein